MQFKFCMIIPICLIFINFVLFQKNLPGAREPWSEDYSIFWALSNFFLKKTKRANKTSHKLYEVKEQRFYRRFYRESEEMKIWSLFLSAVLGSVLEKSNFQLKIREKRPKTGKNSAECKNQRLLHTLEHRFFHKNTHFYH